MLLKVLNNGLYEILMKQITNSGTQISEKAFLK